MRCGAIGTDAADVLERELTQVGRAILRLGVPPGALQAGERLERSAYWAMVLLDESEGPLRLSELAAAMELDLSTVSRHVRHLSDSDLVVRDSDPADGRACLVSLSPRGRQVLEAVRDSRRALLRRVLAGWNPQDQQAVATAVCALAAALHAVAGERDGSASATGLPGDTHAGSRAGGAWRTRPRAVAPRPAAGAEVVEPAVPAELATGEDGAVTAGRSRTTASRGGTR